MVIYCKSEIVGKTRGLILKSEVVGKTRWLKPQKRKSEIVGKTRR